MSETIGLNWAPAACTLPTVERPLRVAEFDDLFHTAAQRVERVAPTMGRVTLADDAEERARDLAARETECCSFFSFTFERTRGELVMEVAVPVEHVSVLDALLTTAGTASDD